jgi:hypothetical protein
MKGIKMITIKINNEENDVETLSNEAKNRLALIEFVDSELARLKSKTVFLQTAHIT